MTHVPQLNGQACQLALGPPRLQRADDEVDLHPVLLESSQRLAQTSIMSRGHR